MDTATPANSTFTGADLINPTGTGNTLNVTYTGAAPVADATGGASITGIQTFNIRNVDTAAGGVTLNASFVPGLTAVNANLSTGLVLVTNLAAGASAGVIGNGAVANGTFAVAYKDSATAAILNVMGGTTATVGADITIDGTSAASALTSAMINSTGAANKLTEIDLGFAFGPMSTATINATTALTVGTAVPGSGLWANNTVGLTQLNIIGPAATAITIVHDIVAASIGITDAAGSGSLTIGRLIDSAAVSEVFTNNGTSAMSITNDGAVLASLTLSGQVADTVTADAVVTSVIVAGGLDNANVSLTFSGAITGTDTIALGNGNDTINVATMTTGALHASVGNGLDLITLGAMGPHTGADTITFTAANGSTASTLFTTIAGDTVGAQSHTTTITWANAAPATTLNTIAGTNSLASGLAVALTDGTAYTVWSDAANTYVYENTGTVATSELVAIVGVNHTFTYTTAHAVVLT